MSLTGLIKALAAALLVGLAWLVGKFTYEYFHPYINGTITRKGR
jgi:hypothetical protein